MTIQELIDALWEISSDRSQKVYVKRGEAHGDEVTGVSIKKDGTIVITKSKTASSL